MNVSTLNSSLKSLASGLGLDGWQLANGKYNGCSFCHFTSIPLLENNPLYQAGTNIVSNINQTFGKNILNQEDPNGTGKLYNTVIGLLQMSDEYIPQIAIKPLPYGVKVNTEDMGTGGYEFKFTITAIGNDYKLALDNIEKAIKNPPAGDLNLQLVHPERGIINGITRCTAFRRIASTNTWRGATAEITFRSEQSNITSNAKSSYIQQVTNAIFTALDAINAVKATFAALTATISTTKRLLGFNDVSSKSPTVTTQIKNMESKTNKLNETLLQSTNYIYKYSNTGASNSTLNSTTLDTDYIPSALAFPTTYNALQGSLILDNYSILCNGLIDTIVSYGYGGKANNMINTIRQSIANLYNVANLCAQNVVNYAYEVPYTMSIHEVLARNNIGFNKALDVLKANSNILSANYIPAGTKVLL